MANYCKNCVFHTPLHGTYLKDECKHPSLFKESEAHFFFGMDYQPAYKTSVEYRMSIRNADLNCRDYRRFEEPEKLEEPKPPKKRFWK
jgi:hypothetical protein